MTREDLEQYPSLLKEIEDLKSRVRRVQRDHKAFEVADTVKDYTKNKTIIIRGIDWDSYDRKVEKYIKQLEKRIEKAATLKCEIEDFIAQIPDSLTRRIFTLRYMDDKKFHQIAIELHMGGESTPRKKHDRYLENYFSLSDCSEKPML